LLKARPNIGSDSFDDVSLSFEQFMVVGPDSNNTVIIEILAYILGWNWILCSHIAGSVDIWTWTVRSISDGPDFEIRF
jgi:hypothetical protein